VRVETDEKMSDCTLSLSGAPSNRVHLDEPGLEVRY